MYRYSIHVKFYRFLLLFVICVSFKRDFVFCRCRLKKFALRYYSNMYDYVFLMIFCIFNIKYRFQCLNFSTNVPCRRFCLIFFWFFVSFQGNYWCTACRHIKNSTKRHPRRCCLSLWYLWWKSMPSHTIRSSGWVWNWIPIILKHFLRSDNNCRKRNSY